MQAYNLAGDFWITLYQARFVIVVKFLFDCYVGNDILTFFVLKHNPLISLRFSCGLYACKIFSFSHCNDYIII